MALDRHYREGTVITNDPRIGKVFTFSGQSFRHWLIPFERTKLGSYRYHSVWWDNDSRKPRKCVKQSGWMPRDFDITKQVTDAELPPEVLERFIEASVIQSGR